MMISALERQKKHTKNSLSYGLLTTTAPLCFSHCECAIGSIGRHSQLCRRTCWDHLIAIPCALIICCAVCVGNLLMPRAT